MLITTKSGRLIEIPTDEEDAAINAGIAADPDTYELSAEEFAQLKPYKGGRPSLSNSNILYIKYQYKSNCYKYLKP